MRGGSSCNHGGISTLSYACAFPLFCPRTPRPTNMVDGRVSGRVWEPGYYSYALDLMGTWSCLPLTSVQHARWTALVRMILLGRMMMYGLVHPSQNETNNVSTRGHEDRRYLHSTSIPLYIVPN